MRKTLTVKPKIESQNILDILEDDTSYKLETAPDIHIGYSGTDEAPGMNRSESFSIRKSEASSRGTSRRSSKSLSSATEGRSLSRSSSLTSLVTNTNFHIKKGISTSTKLSKG